MESSLNWNKEWSDKWELNYGTHFSNASNDYFNRNNKYSNVLWSLERKNSILPIRINYMYAYNHNKGLPEDSISVEDNQKQMFGIVIEKSLFEVFTLNQSLAKSRIETVDRTFIGSVSNSSIIMFINKGSYLIDNYFNYELNKTFLESREQQTSNLRFAYTRALNQFDLSVKLLSLDQDVYTYQEKTDYQKKLDYLDNLILQRQFMDLIIWNFKQNGDFRRNVYQNNRNKNNWTFDNYIDSYFKYDNDNLLLKLGAKHNYKKRYLKIDEQNRKSIDRSLYSYIQFYELPADTISIDVSVLLTQNFHSYPYNSLDNDRQIQLFSLYIQDQLNHLVSINGLASLQRSHEVFISSSLSSNNNRKTTYLIQPEIMTQLSNNFQIFNKYHIRATYENYIWNDYLNDRFYRRINAEWGFNLGKNQELNRSRLQVSYSYESNETADYNKSEWLVNSRNIIRTISGKLRINQDRLTYRIEPQMKYQYKKYESEILFDLNWNFMPESSFKITINPIGNTFNKLIWKVYAGMDFIY